ncbi:MAG: 50S ribosomal protein L22 [Clostridiales bacterium]|nr:50S ribosomal protein L22 [Clostridiales bacterium]
METRAVAKYIRISPRKARMTADLIRGKNVIEAEAILQYTKNKGAEVIIKVLRSAVANAENNDEMAKDDLKVTRIFIDQGPGLKRVKPRAQGRADRMVRRSSHITVFVGDGMED